jgi:hypothetical protein
MGLYEQIRGASDDAAFLRMGGRFEGGNPCGATGCTADGAAFVVRFLPSRGNDAYLQRTMATQHRSLGNAR